MAKDFKIIDILDAVDSIYEIERKKESTLKIKNNFANIDGILPNVDHSKSNKSDILVLDQMIE
jgi:hypothetical protein